MYNKTIIRFGFCDIQNYRGLGKGYEPQPSADKIFLLFCLTLDASVHLVGSQSDVHA